MSPGYSPEITRALIRLLAGAWRLGPIPTGAAERGSGHWRRTCAHRSAAPGSAAAPSATAWHGLQHTTAAPNGPNRQLGPQRSTVGHAHHMV
eukprot:gene24479-biopygen4415